MSSIQTVSPLSIVFMCITLLICFGVPVGLVVWAKVKYKQAFSFLPLLLGVVGFALFQVVIRLGFILPTIQSTEWFKQSITLPWFQWAYVGFLCITAGLFEEPVRFAAYSILNRRRQYPDGLSYGIGHGGIEAILIVGFTYVNNISYSIANNLGLFGSLVAATPQIYQAQLLTNMSLLLNTSANAPELFLFAGIERLFTIPVQIAFSLLVLRGFMLNRKWQYLILTTLLHAMFDFVISVMRMNRLDAWQIEGAIGVMAILSVLYIIKQARDWRKSLAQPQAEVLQPAAE